MSHPQLALVIPVYNESEVLPELLARLTVLFDTHPAITWSAILIDDGSRDDSATQLQAKCQSDPRFRLLGLSRNFGFQAALMAGLAHATDFDAVVTMDADLQDPPEVIPALVARWQEVLVWGAFLFFPLVMVTARMTNVYVSDTYALTSGVGLLSLTLLPLNARPRKLTSLIPALLFVLLIPISIAQARTWSSDAALWEQAWRVSPTPTTTASANATAC